MDILTFFDILLKPPQPFTGLFLIRLDALSGINQCDDQDYLFMIRINLD